LTLHQKSALYVSAVTSFSVTFMGSSLNLSVPAIGEEFMVPASLLGWVVTGYILTVAAFSVPFGRLSDLVGRKKIIVPGLLFYGVTSLLAVYSPTMLYLIVIRGIQGISGAMIFSTNMPFLINAFPPNQRGRVLGFSTAATYAGLSMGPVLGGVLNHYLGWRSIFWVVFFLVVSVSIVAIKNLPGDQKGFRGEDLKSVDLPGNGLYVFTLIAGIYGFTLLGSQGIALYMVLAGGITFAAFVWWERKAETPLIKVSLFTQNRGFAFSNLAAMLNYGATFAVGYLMSIYLQLIMGFNSQAAGLVMISQPVIMMAISPVAGRLSDRFSPFKLSSAGMGICALGLGFFLFITETTSLAWIILGLAVTGIGFGFFSSPNTNAVMSSVEAKDHGVAASVLATMRSIGHSLNMALVTVVVGIYMGDLPLAKAPPELLIFTIHRIFFICIFVCILGVFVSLARKKS